MSFVRVGAKNVHRKKTSVRKKAWDDTVNDLDAYKATPEEIAYRKASHQSKHAVSSHVHRPGSAKKGKRSNTAARKIAIMKEVLYDQQKLQDVLERSDTMMAVVKDLFGDDPRRFEGFPSVTAAPNRQGGDIESTLVNLPPEMRTRTEAISDSMMSTSALNDFQDSDSEAEESHPSPLNYQPKINLQRFQQFIEAEERNHTLSTISGQAGMSHLGQTYASQLAGGVMSSQLPDQTNTTAGRVDGMLQTPPKKDRRNPNESLEILQPPKSAMNDTGKINKTKRRIPKPEPSLNTSTLTLNELRKVLEGLEDELAEYEQQTGRRPPAERQRQESFSGYTLAIVDAVTKLTRYLRECELQLKAEMIVREQLSQDVVQFRALADALTTDLILTQEEMNRMAGNFLKFRVETQQEIQKLKGERVGVEARTSPDQPAEPVRTETPPKSQHTYQPDMPQGHRQDQIPRPIPDHVKPVAAAVMLSPPVRKSRVAEPDRDSQPQQLSLMDLGEYVSNSDPNANNSAGTDSFADLPGTCPEPQYNSQPSLQTAANQNMNSGQYQAPVSIQQQNSVSVPRPAPLVQSNVGVPLPLTNMNNQASVNSQSNGAHQQPISVVAQDRPMTLQRHVDPVSGMSQSQHSDRSHDSTGSNRGHLANQIAELNKQHEEAQRRLQSLIIHQRGMTDTQKQQEQQQQQQQQQSERETEARYQQQQRQQVMDNQQNLRQQQLQYEQQQKLIEMVMQQQQKISQQQRQQQHSSQQQQQQQQQNGLPKPNIPREAENSGSVPVRQSAEFPGYRPLPKQTGLPDYPVSPNISPITERSENHRNMYQSVDFQHEGGMAPASRGITVSIPMVDMDHSLASLSPTPRTAR